jgi:hypothetical protein
MQINYGGAASTPSPDQVILSSTRSEKTPELNVDTPELDESPSKNALLDMQEGILNSQVTPNTEDSIHRQNQLLELLSYTKYNAHSDIDDIWNINSVLTALGTSNNTYNAIEKIQDPTEKQEAKNKWEKSVALSKHNQSTVSDILLYSQQTHSNIQNVLQNEIDSIQVTALQLFMNNPPTKPSIGGHVNNLQQEAFSEALAYGKYDTLHDFKPSTRNKIFPQSLIGTKKITTDSGRQLILLLEDILKGVTTTPGSTNMESKLYGYIDADPLHFEEDIKTDYLKGDIASTLDDVSYHFELPPDKTLPTTWSEPRRDFFKDQTIHSLDSLFDEIKQNEINYWVFDACMSSKIKDKLPAERLVTLANMWDPVKSGLINKSDLGEQILITSIGPSLVLVPDGPSVDGHEIYDWQFNGTSLYDLIYKDLLNHDDLNTTYNLNIKLRLAINAEEECRVMIKLQHEDAQKKISELKLVIDNGFSVNELAMGLHYIETGETSVKDTTKTIHLDLQKIIDFLFNEYKENLKQSSNPFADISQLSKYYKNEFYKILFRFKASGDHGQAEMVKIINTVLNKPTIFMTGDNLAYAYSISKEIPTVACYYKASKPKKSETPPKLKKSPTSVADPLATPDDDDDEDLDKTKDEDVVDEDDSAPQYIVGYFPKKDTAETYVRKFKEISLVINSLYESTVLPTFTLIQLTPEQIEDTLQKLDVISAKNEETIRQLQSKRQQYDPKTKKTIMPDYSSIITDRLEEIMREIEPLYNVLQSIHSQCSWSNNSKQDTIFGEYDPDLKKQYYQHVKTFVTRISVFINSCFFIKNYTKILSYVNENILETSSILSTIVTLIDSVELFTNVNFKLQKELGLETRPEASIPNPLYSPPGAKLEKDIIVINDRPTVVPKTFTTTEFLSKYGDAENTTTKTLSRYIREVYNKLLKSKRKLAKTIATDLKLDKKSYDAIVERIDRIRAVYLSRLLNTIRAIPILGKAYADYFEECFTTPTIDHAEMEKIYRDDIASDPLIKIYEIKLDILKLTTKLGTEKDELKKVRSNNGRATSMLDKMKLKDPIDEHAIGLKEKLIAGYAAQIKEFEDSIDTIQKEMDALNVKLIEIETPDIKPKLQTLVAIDETFTTALTANPENSVQIITMTTEQIESLVDDRAADLHASNVEKCIGTLPDQPLDVLPPILIQTTKSSETTELCSAVADSLLDKEDPTTLPSIEETLMDEEVLDVLFTITQTVLDKEDADVLVAIKNEEVSIPAGVTAPVFPSKKSASTEEPEPVATSADATPPPPVATSAYATPPPPVATSADATPPPPVATSADATPPPAASKKQKTPASSPTPPPPRRSSRLADAKKSGGSTRKQHKKITKRKPKNYHKRTK